jgi:hypothetical protein
VNDDTGKITDNDDDTDLDTTTIQPLCNLTPLALLARLSATGSISMDERDAGELVARCAMFVYSRPAADGAAHIPIRDADGRWQNPLLRGQAIKAKLESCLASIRTPNRRKAVTLALVSRDRTPDWEDTSALSCGLEDIVKFLWPVSARATTTKAGVTLVDATPQRLQHANDNVLGADGVRRIIESPLDKMHAKGQLDSDKTLNDILYSAGRNYYQNFYYGGLAGIGGIDYSRIGGGGDTSPAHMMPRSEFALRHRLEIRGARAALPSRYRNIVDLIILDERTISDIAIDVTNYRDPVSARAVAKERFIVALQLLASYYRLLVRNEKAA